ncbi:hypothetical protein [Cryobacterium sp. TMT1-66-1]|uniref:hypothetical protein n=1 Tax=Cryobacterium sp. TMT1-66-1 TaxID=1259242 RepID=UPI00106C365C|nr:hypothetical protein E3T29_11765 [Cryobacterium sp. TMT1-66-1]
MSRLDAEPPREGAPREGPTASVPQTGSIWPHVEEAIVDQVLTHTSSIVFANSRRLAERLTARFNEIPRRTDGVGRGRDAGHGRRFRLGCGIRRRCSIPAPSISGHRLTAALIAASGQSQGAEPLLARTHHGSVSNVFGVRMRPLPRL